MSAAQVDVLETQFSQLLERVRNTHDFESITFAHEQFLAALQIQLFMNMPSVSWFKVRLFNNIRLSFEMSMLVN